MKIFLLLVLILFSITTFSSEDRWISFDWDPITGANRYEIELLEKKDKDTLSIGIFKTDVPEWTKAVPPGNYFIKIRALDKRNVPGDWSEIIPINIKTPPPRLDYPKYEEKIEINAAESSTQSFSWSPIVSTKYYYFQLYNQDQKLIYSEMTEALTLKMPLAKPGKYSWSVTGTNSKDEKELEFDTELQKQPFHVTFGKLNAPEINVESTKNNLLIRWTKNKDSKNFKHYLVKLYEQKLNEETEQFFLKNEKAFNKNTLNITKSKIKKGTYKITIQSIGINYEDSEESELIYEYDSVGFKVISEFSGNDLDANIRQLKKNIFDFSLSSANLSYSFTNFESDTKSQQSLTGQGISIGYLRNLDLKLFEQKSNIQSEINLYKLADTFSDAIFANAQSSLGLAWNIKAFTLKPHLGFFVYKTPAFIVSRLNTQSVTLKDIITLGPYLYLQEQFQLTDEITIFAEQKAFIHLLSPSGLDDNTFMTNISFNASLGGKYYFRKNFDFNVRATLEKMTLSSKASTSGTSLAQSSDENNIDISGTLYSLGLSYYF